ncbi:hypothetical protein ES707_12469 [subsurface metagenome]
MPEVTAKEETNNKNEDDDEGFDNNNIYLNIDIYHNTVKDSNYFRHR